MLWSDPFLDELEKISVQLTAKERRGQAVKFTALGAVSMPVFSGIKNLIQSGKIMPHDGSKLRWLAGNLVGGGLLSGVMPTVRHQIERSTISQAKARRASNG